MAYLIERQGKARWWMRVKVRGRWVSRTTPYLRSPEHKRDAQRFADRTQERIDRDERNGKPIAMTVRAFFEKWIATREHLASARNQESRLRHHVLPRMGNQLIGDVEPRHVRELMAALRSETELAPRTIRHVYGDLVSMFKAARLDGHVTHDVCILGADQLPRIEDKDRGWREHAWFTHAEVETLIGDDRIPEDRRVQYALAFLTGMRSGELVALTWSMWDVTCERLGRLTLATSFDTHRRRTKGTKTGAIRLVPVHPTLAAMLTSWRESGWRTFMGREPEPDDLIMPAPPDTRRRGYAGDPHRDLNLIRKAWTRDLATLGVRYRRAYDARATFISLAVADGADPTILEERVTHTKRSRSAFAGYFRGQSRPWLEACAEVAS